MASCLFYSLVKVNIMLKKSSPGQPEQQSTHLSLYYYPTCPFCVMVLNVIDDLELNIELRHIFTNPDWREELIQQGGSKTVPCLRIDHPETGIQWMYEYARYYTLP